MKVSRRFCGFLLATNFFGGSFAFAQSDKEYVDDIRSKLAYEVSHLEGQQYRRQGQEVIGVLARGGIKQVPLALDAGASYVFIAACDKDCDHAHVALLDPQGRRLVESSEKEPVVIIYGTLVTAGTYTAEMNHPGCKEKACHAGLVVMRHGSTATIDPPPQQGPPRQRSEKELVEALQRELERVACNPGEIDGIWGDDTREALSEFAKHTNSVVNLDGPDEATLAAVSAFKDRACPAEAPKQRITDGRWSGAWGGRAAATVLISHGKVIRYRYRGRVVPITRDSSSGNSITFGSDTYTVRVVFESDRSATAHYRHHFNGNTATANLTRQYPP